MMWLEHPMLGNRWEVTSALLTLLVFLSLATISQTVLTIGVFVEDAFVSVVPAYDGLFTVLLAGIGMSWVAAIVGAWVNGGPGLVVTLALLPTGIGALGRGQFALTVDLGVAFATATVAVWMAVWVSYSPDEMVEGIEWAGLLGSAVTGLAAPIVWRGTANVGPYATPGAMLAWGLFATGLVFGVIWVIAQLRISKNGAATRS